MIYKCDNLINAH